MASVSDADLKNMSQEERVTALGMRTEQLTGRSMFIEFDEDAEERFTYPWAPASYKDLKGFHQKDHYRYQRIFSSWTYNCLSFTFFTIALNYKSGKCTWHKSQIIPMRDFFE